MEVQRVGASRRSGCIKRMPNSLHCSWLQHVDDRCSPEEVELLELGLGGEIDSTMLPQVKTASGLYHALLQHKKELEDEKVLQMFTSVMRNDLRWENLVQHLSRYELACPKPLEKDEMSDDFRLRLLLLQICIKVKGTKVEDFLGSNLSRHIPTRTCTPGQFTSLAQVFIKMTSGPSPHLHWSNIRDNYLVQLLQNQARTNILRLVDEFLKNMGESPLEITPVPEKEDFSKSEPGLIDPIFYTTRRLTSLPVITDATFDLKTEENLKQWLQESDEIISGSAENLELVKLCFRAELKSKKETFSFLMAKSLPETFLVLRRSAAFASISTLLSRFLHALEKLGKQRGGQECVERASHLLGKVPDVEVSSLSKESQFYQCLIQIRVNLHPTVLARLKAYFLDAAYRKENFSSLTYIFTMLLNDDFFDEYDQSSLIRAFLITQAKHYIKYIIDYRETNNLPQLFINEENLTVHEIEGNSPKTVDMSKSLTTSEKYVTLHQVAYEDSPVQSPLGYNKSQSMQGEILRLRGVEILRYPILGRGKFGYVFRGKYNQHPCAVKVLESLGMQIAESLPVLPPVQENALISLRTECRFLNTIKHKNIVECFTAFNHPECNLPILVLECLDCNLSTYITTKPLSLSLQLHIVTDISEALQYLHKKNIVHRDLCGENILLKLNASPHPLLVKISDFGISTIMEANKISDGRVYLTPFGHRSGYLPQEAKSSPAYYDKSLDIFMFGGVMTQIVKKVADIRSSEHRHKLICDIPEQHPLKGVILRCLDDNMSERPLASELVKIFQQIKCEFFPSCYHIMFAESLCACI